MTLPSEGKNKAGINPKKINLGKRPIVIRSLRQQWRPDTHSKKQALTRTGKKREEESEKP